MKENQEVHQQCLLEILCCLQLRLWLDDDLTGNQMMVSSIEKIQRGWT